MNLKQIDFATCELEAKYASGQLVGAARNAAVFTLQDMMDRLDEISNEMDNIAKHALDNMLHSLNAAIMELMHNGKDNELMIELMQHESELIRLKSLPSLDDEHIIYCGKVSELLENLEG